MKRLTHGNELGTVAKGAGISFAGRIVAGVLQYLYHILIARFLGAASLGLYLLGVTVINLAGVLSRLGLDSGVVRFVSLYRGEGDMARVKGTIMQAMKIASLAGLVIGLLFTLLSGTISERLFHTPELALVIRCFAFLIPFSAVTVLSLNATRAFRMMRFTVYVNNLFIPFVKIGLALVLLLLGWGLYGVLAVHVIAVLSGTAMAVYYLCKVFPGIKGEIVPIFEGKRLLRYSLPLLFTDFFKFFLMWTDTLMLGYYLSVKEVGIYNAAVQTAMLIILVLTAFNSIFSPIIADLFNKNEMEKVNVLLKTITKWVVSLSLPCFCLAALVAKDLLPIFGPEFVVAWVPLIILAFSQLINAFTGSVGLILIMTGKQDIVLFNQVGTVTINILLNMLLIPKFGIVGAAVATGISLVLLNILKLLEVYYFYRIHPYTKDFLKPILASAFTFILVYIGKSRIDLLSGLTGIILSSLLFLSVYMVFLKFLGFSEEDMFIVDKLKNKFAFQR